MSDYEFVRAQIAEVMFDDDSCNDEDCEACQATTDAIANRVVNLIRFSR